MFLRNYFSLNYLVLVPVAVVMGLGGGWLCNFFLDQPFPLYSYAIASCLTWFFLGGSVKNSPLGGAIGVGFISPFIGAGFLGVVLYTVESGLANFHASELARAFYGYMAYSTIFIMQKWFIVLPIGIATALLLRRLLSNETGVTMDHGPPQMKGVRPH